MCPHPPACKMRKHHALGNTLLPEGFRHCKLSQPAWPEIRGLGTSCLMALLPENMPGSLKVRRMVTSMSCACTSRLPLCVMTRLPVISPVTWDVPCSAIAVGWHCCQGPSLLKSVHVNIACVLDLSQRLPCNALPEGTQHVGCCRIGESNIVHAEPLMRGSWPCNRHSSAQQRIRSGRMVPCARRRSRRHGR